ncbi:MAG: tetratricopeptide repeat protein [Actinomycetota bacterium]
MRLRAGAVLAAAALAAGISYISWNPQGREAPPSSGRSVAEASRGGSLAQAPTRTSADEIDRLIRAYEARVRTQPNVTDFTFLGRLYLEKGRLTGDVATYARADTALRRSLEIYPEDAEARSLLASVRYVSHDFRSALQIAGSLYAEDGSEFGALAVLGDAHLELGHYGRAADAYSTLTEALPSVPAVDVRASRLAFLNGDVDGARRLARIAEKGARSTGVTGAGLAWYRSYRGHLEFETGRYRESERLYASALDVAPGYHVALFGLGRAQAARGDTDRAIRSYRRAIAIVPQPDYLAALGDLYTVTGRAGLARRQYETVELIATLAKINEQVFNRQLVLFYADHDLNLRPALRSAAAELRVRKDVFGHDAYAWTLYKNGKYVRARAAADRALGLGTPDARLLYHSGMISAALGAEDRARDELRRALALSPRFDPLQAERAEAALAILDREAR